MQLKSLMENWPRLSESEKSELYHRAMWEAAQTFEPELSPARHWYHVKLPPIIIGQLAVLAILFIAQPDVTLHSASAGAVLGIAWEVGKQILKG